MKKVGIVVLLCLSAYFLGIITTNVRITNKSKKLENQVIYKIKVNVEKINLRKEIDLHSSIIKEVYKDEVFDVVKYQEGNTYNWYNIIYADGKTGWIASGKEISWVEVIKNKEKCSNEK